MGNAHEVYIQGVGFRPIDSAAARVAEYPNENKAKKIEHISIYCQEEMSWKNMFLVSLDISISVCSSTVSVLREVVLEC